MPVKSFFMGFSGLIICSIHTWNQLKRFTLKLVPQVFVVSFKVLLVLCDQSEVNLSVKRKEEKKKKELLVRLRKRVENKTL